ncbi:MAG: ABC transporter permease, partial [Defluviitaleaceae bacterium]|nr:ABC transporter permease [Defluviitaleaceae bacterium]
MKSPLRLVSRKMRRHIPQLLGLILLLAVGVSFFVTLFTILMRYEETADQFFSDHNYADVTFYGVFDHESVALLSGFDGVLRSEGRVVHDFRNDEQMIRAISLTHDINTLHLDDGRLPSNQMEGVLLRQNANAMDLLIGDTIVVGHRELQITGIAYSPEYIYLVQNERNPIAGADVFGVIFVTRDFFAENDNEIVVMTDDHFDITEAGQAIGAFHHLQRQGQVNYQMYRDALEQFVTFAYIFPFIFAVLIVVITYIVLSRTIQKDRKQIGIMKALGTSNKRIIFVYLSQFFFTAIVGAMIGCTTAIFLTDIVINMFSAVFIVPTLGFAFYPALWLSATITSIILCVLSSWIALLGILQVMPAHAMSPRLPKGGNKIFIEHIEFLWKSFTFNTRYTLKNAFRNKGRFLVIVLGMAASCALLMFSFGFNDSIMNTK